MPLTRVGENVAFTTRSADTFLFLDDGQTIVLAGLIKHNKAETVKGVPFLRRIPIIGFLFRSKNWPADFEQEVVITMTPRIVTQKNMTLDNQEIRKKYSIAEDLYKEDAAQAEAEQGMQPEEPISEEALTSEKLESISDEIDAILEEDLDQVEEEFESSGFPPAPAELTDQELDDRHPRLKKRCRIPT